MRVAFDMAFGVREGIMCHYCSLGREVGKSPCGGVRPRLSDKRAASASWNALAWRQEPPGCIIPTQGRTVKPYDLSVSVSPRFVPEQSDPGEHQFVFAYTVRITNTGEHPAQVISRHWIITDGNQRVQEVRGLGVVGSSLLAPGETFEYTSGCPLPTRWARCAAPIIASARTASRSRCRFPNSSWRCRVPCTDAARRLFFWPMKRILCLSVLSALLAACTTTSEIP